MTDSRQTQQRLAYANRGALPHLLMEGKAVGGKDEHGRSMLKPAHFLALPEWRIAGENVVPTVLQAEQNIEKMQANAGDEHRCHRHQHDRVAGGGKLRAQQRALVLAKELFDTPQRDWVDVPGVPGEVGDLIDA